MPAQTSTGIIYPCGGEQIDCDVFATHAQTMQAAVNEVQELADQSLRPPAAWVRTALAGQNIAAGATTTISYDATFTMYDTGGFFNSAAPTILTVPENGSYLVQCWFTRVNIPTTELSHRVAILVGGAEMAFNKSDNGTASFSASAPYFTSALLPGLAAGSQITTTHLFTGTGSMNIRHAVSITKVSNA